MAVWRVVSKAFVTGMMKAANWVDQWVEKKVAQLAVLKAGNRAVWMAGTRAVWMVWKKVGLMVGQRVAVMVDWSAASMAASMDTKTVDATAALSVGLLVVSKVDSWAVTWAGQ